MIVRNFLSGVEEKPKSTIYVTGLNSTDTVYATSPSGKRVNAVWGQMKNPDWIGLPSGYKQLTKITSDGASYIDLLKKPTKDTRIKASATFLQRSDRAVLFGAMRLQSPYHYFAFGLNHTGFTYYIASGSGTESTAGSFTLNQETEIDFNNNGSVIIDGVTIRNVTFATDINNQTLSVFACHQYVTYPSTQVIYPYKTKGSLSYLQWIENGVLEGNYSPCLRISDNKVSLYDTVSNSFIEPNGTFIAGEEVPEYIDCFIIEVSELGNFVITTPTTTQNVLVDEVGEYLVEF